MAVGPSVQQNNQAVSISNAQIPKEGSRMVPYVVLLNGTGSEFEIDLTIPIQQGRFSIIQSVYIDASECDAELTLHVENTIMQISVAPGDQGFYPLLVPSNPKILITSDSTKNANVIFLNIPLPANVWTADHSSQTLSAAITSPLDGGNKVVVGVAALTGNKVSYSVATPNPAASTELIPAAGGGTPIIEFYKVKAPETADLWVNELGGTAGVDLPDCFKVPAGTLYYSALGELVNQGQAITFYTTATAANLTCVAQTTSV